MRDVLSWVSRRLQVAAAAALVLAAVQVAEAAAQSGPSPAAGVRMALRPIR